jgi:hypothetical protein
MLLISDLRSSGIMRPFTGCLLSILWRALSDYIFKRVTCPVLYWTSDPWRYDHVQRSISDPSRCGRYRVSKRWTVTPLTYAFDHRGNRIQLSSVSDICLSPVHTGCRSHHPTIQWTSGSVPSERTELDVTNQFLPVQRLCLRGGISSFYTGLHGVLLRQTWVYLYVSIT